LRTVTLVSERRDAIGRLLLFPALVLTGLLAPQRTAKADPITELRSLSVFPNAELVKLAGGDVLASRGPAMNSGRALSVESAYILRLPLKSAVAFQQKWTPVRHPELKVFIQGDLSGKGTAADFQKLATAPANSSVKNFIDVTLRLPGDGSKLQLSQAEVRSYVPGGATSGTVPAAVTDFWTKILLQRAQSFASGGLSGLAPYETTGSPIRAADEVAQLVKDSPKVQSQFASLISGTAIGGGKGSLPGAPYWQLFDVDGLAAVTLGASYVKPSGAGYQLADLQYYASGGIYALVAFYQLWPVQIAGREETLVWRVDLTSASALGNLRGVERLGSGAAMMREVQKSVRALLTDVPGGR
jgi:hypothetical protein